MTTQLTLYVSGDCPGSRRAAVAIRDWCEGHCGGRYRLDVLDIDTRTHQGAAPQVLVTPTLENREPPARVAGDLRDLPRVMAALGLGTSPGDDAPAYGPDRG